MIVANRWSQRETAVRWALPRYAAKVAAALAGIKQQTWCSLSADAPLNATMRLSHPAGERHGTDHRTGKPEGRGRQNVEHDQSRRGTGRATAARAARRFRPPGIADGGAGHQCS